MEKQDIYPLIESTEDGMKLVRDKKNIALIGGRETFFFDTRRFGTNLLTPSCLFCLWPWLAFASSTYSRSTIDNNLAVVKALT